MPERRMRKWTPTTATGLERVRERRGPNPRGKTSPGNRPPRSWRRSTNERRRQHRTPKRRFRKQTRSLRTGRPGRGVPTTGRIRSVRSRTPTRKRRSANRRRRAGRWAKDGGSSRPEDTLSLVTTSPPYTEPPTPGTKNLTSLGAARPPSVDPISSPAQALGGRGEKTPPPSEMKTLNRL